MNKFYVPALKTEKVILDHTKDYELSSSGRFKWMLIKDDGLTVRTGFINESSYVLTKSAIGEGCTLLIESREHNLPCDFYVSEIV